MHICSLNWKNELLSTISESCSMTAVWCYFGTFQSIVLYNVYFQNSLDTFIFVRSCQNMFHDLLTRLPFSPTLSPLPHRSQLHISAVCAAPPLERPVTVTRVTTCSSPADKQGLGWGYPCNYMSIEETHSHYGCLLLVRIRVYLVLKTGLVKPSCVCSENSKTGFKLFTPGVFLLLLLLFFVFLFLSLFLFCFCFVFVLFLLFLLFVFLFVFFFFILKRILKTSVDVYAMSG